jgi:type III restriction enzyme
MPHKMNGILMARRSPQKDLIIVFPGIELTLNVLCQALLLFDADLPDDLFSLVLTALAITPSAPSESRTITALGL